MKLPNNMTAPEFQEAVRKGLKNAGFGMDAVKNIAKEVIKGNPHLEKEFKEKAKDKSFKKLVDQMYDNIENLVDHETTSEESNDEEDCT
jgi:hypothetical protein